MRAPLFSLRGSLLLVAAFAIISVMLWPTDASATSDTLQSDQLAFIASAESRFSAVPEEGAKPSADLTWTRNALPEAAGFTEATIGSDPNSVQSAESAQYPAPGQAAPTNTKVPEPAALILYGTALIGIAHAARKKMKS